MKETADIIVIEEKIATQKDYAMAIETLEKICSSRDISLEQFFRLIKR